MDFYKFNLVLSHVSSSKEYIIEEKESFRLQSNKQGKNVNTARIAEVAGQALEALKGSEMTDFQRKQNLEQLGESLTLYLNRVHYSKPRFARIVAFFGCRSLSEQKIQMIIYQTLSKPRERDTFLQTFLKLLPLSFDSEAKLSTYLLYHKVLNKKTFRKNLEGLFRSDALKSMIQDLREFAATLPYTHLTLFNLICELSFAYSVAVTIEQEEFLTILPFSPKSGLLDKAAKEIVERIHLLPQWPDSQNHAVLIPGGTREHAVMYRVTRAQNGLYYFNLVNTGEGSHSCMISSAKNEVLIRDLMYKDLTKEQLSQKFIHSLLFKANTATKMEEVNEFIHKELSISNGSNVSLGRPHQGQKKGICAIKCILALFSYELGGDQHRRFKVRITERAIERFEMAIKEKPSLLKKDEIEEIRKEALEVLQRRRSKAQMV